MKAELSAFGSKLWSMEGGLVEASRSTPEGHSTSRDLAPIEAFAPGKVILLGEHAVRYGQPAVAVPLSLGVRVRGIAAPAVSISAAQVNAERQMALQRVIAAAAADIGAPPLSIEIDSNLPMSMGLGSSAALSTACARVLLRSARRLVLHSELLSLAHRMEQEFHGTPSGVDHTCSALGKPISFRVFDGKAKAKVLRVPRAIRGVVALTGMRQGTRTTLTSLDARVRNAPARYSRIMKEIGRLSSEGVKAIARGDVDALGDIMNMNHGLLSALGQTAAVSEEVVERLRAWGAVGAKVTGAGGSGGAVIAICSDPDQIIERLKLAGIGAFDFQFGGL